MTKHVINIDAKITDADWTKKTWDLPREPMYYFLRYGKELPAWLEWIDTVPAGKAMPKYLRAALTGWIEEQRRLDGEMSTKSAQAVVGGLAATLESLEASVETKGL